MGLNRKIPILLGLIFGILFLGACRGARTTQTVTSTMTEGRPGLTLAPAETGTSYPGPADENRQSPTPAGYPAPEAIATPVSAYPAPGEVAIVTATVTQAVAATATMDGYPGPGTAIAQVPATPTTIDAYPGPLEVTDTVNPYPGPQGTATSTGTGAAGLQATQTPLPTTATPLATNITPEVSTATPTVTATPPIVRTRLEASDPDSFQPASGRTQLVEFFAVWSPLSRSMAPVMNGLEERYKERINFVYLDIDDPANGIYKFLLGDRLPPIFLLLDGEGNVLKEWRGYVLSQEFEEMFSTINP